MIADLGTFTATDLMVSQGRDFTVAAVFRGHFSEYGDFKVLESATDLVECFDLVGVLRWRAPDNVGFRLSLLGFRFIFGNA